MVPESGTTLPSALCMVIAVMCLPHIWVSLGSNMGKKPCVPLWFEGAMRKSKIQKILAGSGGHVGFTTGQMGSVACIRSRCDIPVLLHKLSNNRSQPDNGLRGRETIDEELKDWKRVAKLDIDDQTKMSRYLFRPNFFPGPSRMIGKSTINQRMMIEQIRKLSVETRSIIDKAIKSQPIVLFMKGTPELPQCGFSRAVVQLLDLHDVPSSKIKTYNCLEDEELRQGIKEFSDWPTIPQLYIDGEFMGGCDTMMEMHRTGELDEILKNKKIINSPNKKSS